VTGLGVLEIERAWRELKRVYEVGEVARGEAGGVDSAEEGVDEGSEAPREEANDRSWVTSARSCWHSRFFCSSNFF